ncbi:diguanylate cyclase (GGDEF)-like protein [Bradyrhizobium diazoefficiens]|uniref:putative bifunctional diguanylate cyclase/phosphodiesterase n=1 Tax=Bradyrhizobium diazoefficiens TaxID=1355477 RepID=UPI000AE745A4|nr:EAL domain-containing protein [Bradyrhizobium diazoefficiens]MBR0868015.1 EAL domain-containing protein [Bradyrhizobium diazoefficiens]MBR0892417.1 EAL domain-containing protein [Bradyrhizobium diazoefficiens]MBR0924259.1 EAL domain-containing protein [Bradyrhizobium diazoefficiens]
MSLSNPRSRVLHADWFDWRSSATRDFIALFGGVVLASILAHVYELGPRLFQLGRGYADSALDAIVFFMFVAFVLSVALTIFSVRRYRDLARETKARTIAEAEARDLARHDPLTGLPNRRLFDEKLDACLGLAGDTHQVAVLMLGLRGFKRIKDTHGHAAGDKALCAFANRLADVLRTDGVLARIGGDEFGIVMPDISSLEDPTNLARRIVASAGDTFAIETGSAELGVGIGIAIAPIDGVNLHELVRRAERALYRAQGDGRSCVRFFEPEMDMHVDWRIQIERELRSAITADIIEPHYQPFVSLKSNRIIGFEALARWENRTFGHIPPDVFIPIAEETGLINALGDQLFRRACFDANTWPEMFTLAFNISPIQLRDPALGQRILSILGQTGFSPSRLEIEITESAFVEKTGVAKTVMDELRQAGVRIALDDFGTGYATLSQLLSFRLDKIKIDRSFVSHLGDSTDSQVIVRAILGIANGFGLTATAEGVEDAGQLAYLVANGCAEGQGYLFSDAVQAAGIPALLSRESGRTAVAEDGTRSLHA